MADGRVILHYPNPGLAVVCKRIVDFDSSIADIGEILKASIPLNGIAVAANQVEFGLSMFAYKMPDSYTAHVICNPVIVSGRGEWTYREGCLSFPGMFFPIKRPESVRLQGRDVTGASVSIVASGLKGRMFQHECEHLNGRVLLSRISPALRNKAKLAMGLQKGRGTI